MTTGPEAPPRPALWTPIDFTTVAQDSLGAKGDEALVLAAAGRSVSPCRPGTKLPATNNGLTAATTDPELIGRWWRHDPEMNLAVAHEVLLDFDGPASVCSMVLLARAALLVDAGDVVVTPKGFHLLFVGDGSTRNTVNPAWGVDIRGEGGYRIAPPSVVGGRPYTYLRRRPPRAVLPWTAIRAELSRYDTPAPRPLLRPSGPRRVGGPTGGDVVHLARWVEGLQEGERNSGLHWAAHRALDNGTDPDDLAAAALSIGLTHTEVAATLRSVRQRRSA